MRGAESPPADFLTVSCKGQPRCPTAAPAVQRASTLGTVRYMARTGCISVDTMEATGKPKACDPQWESVLKAFPRACVFSSSFSSAGELSSPSPRLFSSSYVACQDCSYKTISHFLGLNEVEGETIGVNVKVILE